MGRYRDPFRGFVSFTLLINSVPEGRDQLKSGRKEILKAGYKVPTESSDINSLAEGIR